MGQGTQNPHAGHRKRLKERFLREGLDAFEPHQILELLLFYAIAQRDTNEIAHRLLRQFGSLSHVLDASPKDLQELGGLSENTAALLSMIPQLSRAYNRDKMQGQLVLDSSSRTGEYVQNLFVGRLYEAFFVICLDKHNRILHEEKVCEGTIDEVPCYPRLVVETVLRHRAKRVVLAHNHPAGARKPSNTDIEATHRLIRILREIEVEVIDHIIVGSDGFVSMADCGVLIADERSE